MQRRRAIVTAATVTATLAAASAAFGVNGGFLSSDSTPTPARVAQIADHEETTTTLAPEVEVRYEDIPVPVAPATPAATSEDEADDPVATAPAADTPTADAPQGEVEHESDDHHDDAEVEDHSDDAEHDSTATVTEQPEHHESDD